MNNYANALAQLQNTILEAEPDKILSSLKSNRTSIKERLNVYIYGYRMRLVQAVLSDYPTLVHYLGKQHTENLALSYVESTPPSSYTLDAYPLKFAEYISINCNDDFAHALARLESAIAEVFWLSDSTPFVPSADLTPEQFMELRFAPRKASKFIHLEYPVEEYMSTMREGKPATSLEKKSNQMLIIRHNNEVKRHIIATIEHLILSQLIAGTAVGEALEKVTSNHPEQFSEIANNIQIWFSKWIENGFFTNEQW